MKNIWQIVTLLMAVALVALSIKVNIIGTQDSEPTSVDSEQIALDAIMTRSSVRSYTSQKVEEEKIEKLLRAGMAAPTAGNKQPWEFMVINDRAILDKIPTIIKGAHMVAKAQQVIIVLGTPAKALMPDYWVQDCSAATQNILVAANAMGLGAVWSGAYPENGSGRVEAMSELLSLPEGTIALNVIVFGYPDSEPVVKNKWDESKIHYNSYE